VVGGAAWITSLVYAGYWFGNIPWVKHNLTWIVLAFVVVSLTPATITYLKERKARKAAAASNAPRE
jgi:membrane-associated protein